MALPAPVAWIGWWLFTPLATCLDWNRQRERLVPEPVIREMAAALADPLFAPSRAEGLASIVAVVPTHHDNLVPLLRDELARLDHRIRAARNREHQLELHGYSRLLDLERRLHLIRLLSRYPDRVAGDAATRAELEAIVSPLPGDRWWHDPRAPHGLAPVSGDPLPYPVELDLPRWTLARDVDLRSLLFGFQGGAADRGTRCPGRRTSPPRPGGLGSLRRRTCGRALRAA